MWLFSFREYFETGALEKGILILKSSFLLPGMGPIEYPYLTLWFSVRSFVPEGTGGKIWGHSGCHTWRWGVLPASGGRGQGCCSLSHNAAGSPHHKKIIQSQVICAQVEKSVSKCLPLHNFSLRN